MPPTPTQYAEALAEIGDPIDDGLSLSDWAQYDSDGYDDAVRFCFEDDWVSILGNAIEGANRFGETNVGGLRAKLKERLRREVSRNAAWIEVWREGRK